MKVLLVVSSLLLGLATTTTWLQPLPSISSASMSSSSFPTFSSARDSPIRPMCQRRRVYMLWLAASSGQQASNDKSGSNSAANVVGGRTNLGEKAATTFAGLMIKNARETQWHTEDTVDKALVGKLRAEFDADRKKVQAMLDMLTTRTNALGAIIVVLTILNVLGALVAK